MFYVLELVGTFVIIIVIYLSFVYF